MIKKGIAITLSVMMAFSLAGCSNGDSKTTKDEKSSYEKCRSEYYGEVELADYEKFLVYSEELNITDEEIESQVNSTLETYKTYEETDETEVKEDSVANISYVGTIKVKKKDFEFEGGTAENKDLDIANSNYIEGFAEGLVGAKVGETVTLNLTFPETYGGTTTDADGNEITLAGQDVKFKVTINGIKKAVYPEFTDDFVAENLNDLYGVSKAEEFKDYITLQNKMSNVLNTTAMDQFVEACDIKVNQDNLKKEVDAALNNLNEALEQQSMTMEDYLSQYVEGQTEEEFKEKLNAEYETMFKTYAVICAVVEKSGTVMTEDKYNELLTQFAKRNGYTDNDTFAQAYESYYGASVEDVLPIQFAYQDALEILLDNATVNDGERPTEEATDAE